MTNVERRMFLASAGAMAFAGTTVRAAKADWSDAEQANVRVVADFCEAWSTRDLKRILSFLADDCVYRMTETTPPATGHAGVTERLGSWLQTSDRIEFRIIETFAKGPMVMNHRVDRFSSSTRPLTWEGVGVFFVKDGKIKEWFDYTIKVER
jgi:limonene-1,2-epoxide hydrolase